MNFSKHSVPVVICADDFALNEAVSAGTIELVKANKITATSVLSLSPHWTSHARLLKKYHNQLDVGLHLDLTSDFAVQAGYGSSVTGVLLKTWSGRANRKKLRLIIESQLDSFENEWGGPPDHIDGHQHVHQFPVVRDALVDVLMDRYGALINKPWVRVSDIYPTNWKAKIITLTGASVLQEKLKQNNVDFTPFLLGSYGFNLGVPMYRSLFTKWLGSVRSLQRKEEQKEGNIFGVNSSTYPAPLSIMCHPAIEPQPLDSISTSRCVEFEYLNSQDFIDDLQHFGVRLVKGSDIFIQKEKR